MLRQLLFASCLNAPMMVGSAAWAQRSDPNVGDALTQPLRDLNILRRESSEVLQRAAIAPYADGPTLPNGALDCASVDAEIESLDVALGEDVDVPIPELRLMAQAGIGANNAIVDAVEDLVELPYRSVIRRLTGADRRDREIRQAAQAGMVRRGFLRGLGARECATPEVLTTAEPAPEVPLSDLELARLQLAAANAAGTAAPEHWTPASETAPDRAVTEVRLSDLELARLQLTTQNATAAAASGLWSPPRESSPGDAPTATGETRFSDLELARTQLAAANAAAASASELWTPARESSPSGAATETRLSNLELARIQLAAANAAAAAASER